MCDPPLWDWEGMGAELLHHELHSCAGTLCSHARLSWAHPASLWQGDGTCEVQTLLTAGTEGDRSRHTQCYGYCTSSGCIHQDGSRSALGPASSSPPNPLARPVFLSPGSSCHPFTRVRISDILDELLECSAPPEPMHQLLSIPPDKRLRGQDAFTPGWCLV